LVGMNGRELLYDRLPSKNRGGNMNIESTLMLSIPAMRLGPSRAGVWFFFAATRSLLRNPIRSRVPSYFTRRHYLSFGCGHSHLGRNENSIFRCFEGRRGCVVTRDNFGSNAPIE